MVLALLHGKNDLFSLKLLYVLSSTLDVDRLSGLNEQLMLSVGKIYCLKTACYVQICVVCRPT